MPNGPRPRDGDGRTIDLIVNGMTTEQTGVGIHGMAPRRTVYPVATTLTGR
jgi:hypothetical protein